MKTFCPDKLEYVTVGGEMVLSMHELDFLFELTGCKAPQEAVEQFAVAALNHWKDPQKLLKSLEIHAGPVYIPEEGLVQIEELTYQRVRYELVRRNISDKG